MTLDLAVKLSQSREAKSYYPKWPMAAVLVKGGSIQSIGFSRKKNDPTYLDRFDYCSVHCEIEALRKVRFQAKNHVLFVARACKGGGVGLAKPCANCQEVIDGSGVKRVTYTITGNEYGVWKP